MYGIPEFRLPKADRREGSRLPRAAGREARVEPGRRPDRSRSTNCSAQQGFDAVFIGVGAGLPMFLGVPGEDLGGVYSANEYLTRSNLMKAYRFPEYDTPVVRGRQVCVIGGGNVAMDAARTALRLGAETVSDRLPPLARGVAGPGRRDPPRRGGGRRLPAADQSRWRSRATSGAWCGG